MYVNWLFSTWGVDLLCGNVQWTHGHMCIMWLATHLDRNDPTSYRFWSATIYLTIAGMAVFLCLPWLEVLIERRFFVWFFAYAFNSSKVRTYVHGQFALSLKRETDIQNLSVCTDSTATVLGTCVWFCHAPCSGTVLLFNMVDGIQGKQVRTYVYDKVKSVKYSPKVSQSTDSQTSPLLCSSCRNVFTDLYLYLACCSHDAEFSQLKLKIVLLCNLTLCGGYLNMLTFMQVC